MEKKWKEWTGKPVTGFFGALWTTFWHLLWGSGIVDASARRGMRKTTFSKADAHCEGYRRYILSWQQFLWREGEQGMLGAHRLNNLLPFSS